jgi:hypothetical protein
MKDAFEVKQNHDRGSHLSQEIEALRLVIDLLDEEEPADTPARPLHW